MQATVQLPWGLSSRTTLLGADSILRATQRARPSLSQTSCCMQSTRAWVCGQQRLTILGQAIISVPVSHADGLTAHAESTMVPVGPELGQRIMQLLQLPVLHGKSVGCIRTSSMCIVAHAAVPVRVCGVAGRSDRSGRAPFTASASFGHACRES